MKNIFKLKITTADNQPVFKGQADRISDFDDPLECLKKKYGENRRKR